jgi:hypothetical protein
MIKDWIQSSYNINTKLSFNSCLFITGYSGTGKSYIINKISKELDLFICTINSNNCSSSIQLGDLLYKSYVSSLIQVLTNNKQKKIIIIDDFDILMAIDNTINLTLYNFINNNSNKLKHIPIICIININLIKKIGEIKKKCKIIQIPNLDEYEIHNILLAYNNNITFNQTIKIITDTEYNLSKAIKIASFTEFNKNDDLIKIEDIYGNIFNRNKFKEIILKEQWIIPLNFHENIIGELINNRKGIKKDKEEFYKKFIKNFCYFDVLMHNNNEIGIDFFVSNTYGLYEFQMKKKKDTLNNNFTKMLSYLSLQKKNNKNSFKSSFPLNQIGNYHLSLLNKKYIY